MTTATTVPAIERRWELAAPRERVWRALADPAELAAWFCARIDFAPVAGHEGWFEFEGHGRVMVRVEVVEAPHRLAWRWAHVPGIALDAAPSTLVEWTLDEAPGGGTVVGLRESGFRRNEDRLSNVQGWLEEFGSLAAHVGSATWEAGILRTYALQSSPERVWRAFSDPVELAAWWGGTDPVEIRAGFEGWWDWPSEGGRFAMRIEAVEAPTYVAWLWSTDKDVPLADSSQVLRTEWVLMPRDDGGTDLHLLETGFRGPMEHDLNVHGWDGDVIPGLRRHLGEAAAAG
jgi:uncharacterized protein YndB with AHSA1/START domain